MTMYPRHVVPCCHMTEGDVIATDNVRRDVDRDITGMLVEHEGL
jgi:hypothetical protein